MATENTFQPTPEAETMKAVLVQEPGGPEVLQVTDVPVPEPGGGEVLVRTEAIGVNYIDVYYRTGVYPQTLPFVPGDEASGVIAAVGPGVRGLTVGHRVAWTAPGGTYAEYALVDSAVAVPVPDGVPAEVAASALAQGMTAHYLAFSIWTLHEGDTVLVHAGAGGVGLLLTQFLAQQGVRVITTVSSPEKADLSRAAGAVEVLGYGDDVPARVRELTNGEGAAVVFDGVGASTFEGSLASVRPRGLVALFGAASGAVPPLDPQRLNTAGSVYLTRPSIGDFLRDRDELLWRAGDVFDGIADGTLRVHVGTTFSLGDACEAHRSLEARLTTGAVVLVP